MRAKDVSDRERHDLAVRLAERCHAHGAMCIVNDRVDVALAVDADGVHLGADDLPVPIARRLLDAADRARLLGATARDAQAAVAQADAGADYLGVGPCYPTRSKVGLPPPGGPARIRDVAAAVELPVIAIAGITAARVPELLAAGAHGVAVLGVVATAPDPRDTVAELLDVLEAAP